MLSICIYLQIHQPFRITGKKPDYFKDRPENEISNKKIFEKVCKNSYLPTAKIIEKILNNYKNFGISVSFSGTVLEQMEKFSPQTLKVFQKLHKTGRFEILSETYYHSLAFFYSKKEFEKQVLMHRQKIKKLFGTRPKVFRNTELAYDNLLAQWAEKAGYKGILTEGWDKYLNDLSPNFVYSPKSSKNIKLLLRNYKFSDDIAFRFSEPKWSDWPLNATKFANWLLKSEGQTVNIFLDYETFGEHQHKDSGIFHFLEELPKEVYKKSKTEFKTVSQTLDSYDSRGEIDVSRVLTWADSERNLSAWTGNRMQKESIKLLYDLEKKILSKNNRKIIKDWRKLQTSDHFYYMSTKSFDDGGIHEYFSHHESPKEAHRIFTDVIGDLKKRIY